MYLFQNCFLIWNFVPSAKIFYKKKFLSVEISFILLFLALCYLRCQVWHYCIIYKNVKKVIKLSCLVLSCLVLSCLVLSCLVLSCLVLSCLVLSCLVLSCLVLSCLVLSCLVLSCLVLSCLVLYWTSPDLNSMRWLGLFTNVTFRKDRKLNFHHRDLITCIVSLAIFHPHFVMRIFHPHFIIRSFSSSFYHPHFSIRHPPSAAIRSAFYSDLFWCVALSDFGKNIFARLMALLTSCKPDKIQNVLSQKPQCYIKKWWECSRAVIELYMHLGGLLSNQEARVARGDSRVRLLRFFRPKQPPACIYNSMTAHFTLTIFKVTGMWRQTGSDVSLTKRYPKTIESPPLSCVLLILYPSYFLIRIFHTPHFLHSWFSTLLIFGTPHFLHSANSTLRTPCISPSSLLALIFAI